ncbi:hypothetical protein [Ruminiclostridium cellobioparum]|jgi:uncharacterized membrane-anchored protein YjiN (DUF445 family)|uniref:hypothetical protein n=1 Tax=Ruminiclostridium cellobioparum TaxID=29355 RepID=UPI000480CFE7|nr:hypothetical protein [Ruminiclostridium cellobioparum]
MEPATSPVTELAVRLKEVSIKNTAEAIYNKINLVKQIQNDKQTINVLEEIINDLTTDKNELIQITKCYEQEFLSQDISDEDIEYITKELLPIITTFLPFSGGDSEFVSTIQKILSAETFKILKLLGFNYKEAIGQPLTNLVAQAIQNQNQNQSQNTNKYPVNKGYSRK